LLEKVLGVHRHKLLPTFAADTFETWFRQQTGGAEETVGGRHPVVLFSTCFANYHKPALGQAAYAVLTHNDCRVACPALNCCGMPALDGGDVDFARTQARQNVARLLPYVERGYQIAVINPTCSLMLRQEYPALLHIPDEPELVDAVQRVAAATRDISEYLFELRRAGHFREDFQSTPGGPVAYHAPCHLRMQNIGFRGRDLLRRISGVQPRLVAECSGHDGTWAMKQENFAFALQNGQKAFDGMRDTNADLWVTDCPLSAIQFEQACGKQALHPVEVLARAYQPDGFAQAIPPPAGNSTRE
jgi:Fe-S oxidoreductase